MRSGKAHTLIMSLMMLGAGGCAVPQPAGNGTCTHFVEPDTDTGYWLYLPAGHVTSDDRRHEGELRSIVLTLHGLHPFDDAEAQIRSWQQEADRYGFIVIAPELRSCSSLFNQYPLRDPSLPCVVADEQGILAVLDNVCERDRGDPDRVLATSFSAGGCLVHFMANRHPERFRCLATRCSNFSEEMLDVERVPRYQQMKVAIFFGEDDLRVCRRQSVRAFEWYRDHGFDVEIRQIDDLGHERRPETAAAFFASVIGALPKTLPESTLVLEDVTIDP
jgi:poly(3-hydroxybutyrate) depolymerase